MTKKIFAEFDWDDFWNNTDYSREECIGAPVAPDDVASIESELSYTLPAAYVELITHQNGGTPRRDEFPGGTPKRWIVTTIFGIDRTKWLSLCGVLGQTNAIDNWEYPPIGIYFADCPSAGHHMFAMDYRECGPEGEPAIVFVDQARDYAISLVAKNFEEFIRGLKPEAK